MQPDSLVTGGELAPTPDWSVAAGCQRPAQSRFTDIEHNLEQT